MTTPNEAKSPENEAETSEQLVEAPTTTRADYLASLNRFDAAICEAIAVSQAASNRFVAAHKGYATKLFTRLCAHGIAMIRAVPLSRWVQSNSENWDFSCAAPHSRAILEGYLLFSYVLETPESKEEWSAKLNVMHLNDCTRRIKLFTNFHNPDQVKSLSIQADEIRERLTKNAFFQSMPTPKQKRFMEGEYLMIDSRNERLEKLGFDQKTFNGIWDLLSQNTHILPLSFYRIEANDRGTGLENDADRGYLTRFLEITKDVLEESTNLMVGAFPDTGGARKGIDSGFSPGPRSNKAIKQAEQKRNAPRR